MRTYPYKVSFIDAVTERRIRGAIDESRTFYNACVEEHQSAYKHGVKNINWVSQSKQLKEIYSNYERVFYRDVLDDVVKRVQQAYDAFYKNIEKWKETSKALRIKRRMKFPTPPKFKPFKKYNSISFTHPDRANFRLEGRWLICNKFKIKLFIDTEPKGEIKKVVIKKEGSSFFVSLVTDDVIIRTYPQTGQSCGIDFGLIDFITLDNGETVSVPQFMKEADLKIAALQKRRDHHQKGSLRYRFHNRRIAKIYAKATRQLDRFHHDVANKILNRFDIVCFQKEGWLAHMRGPFKKSYRRLGFAGFVSILTEKAKQDGKKSIRIVDQWAKTTGVCRDCHTQHSLTLDQREFICEKCGLKQNRDVSAAVEIKRLGLLQEDSGAEQVPQRAGASRERDNVAFSEPSEDLRIKGAGRSQTSPLHPQKRSLRKTSPTKAINFDKNKGFAKAVAIGVG